MFTDAKRNQVYLCQMFGTESFERVKVFGFSNNDIGSREHAFVTCVDIGSTHKVRCKSLFPLPEDLRKIPFQVRNRCKLSKPV